MKFIKKFSEININDVSIVGGKNSSLGEMFNQLSSQNIKVPNGFAVTAQAYWHFINENKIAETLKSLISQFDEKNFQNLQNLSHQIRKLIEEQEIPLDLKKEIIKSYNQLCKEYNKNNCAVAVRSSATAEDLPNASFAGQQETFLNIKGKDKLLQSYKKCLSSLFTPRAIVYRIENKIDHLKVALSVGIQIMIDAQSSGVAFTLDTETGFKDVIFINSSWGLGEAIVQGIVDPDSFYVHKPTLEQDFKPILKKKLGYKSVQTVFKKSAIINKSVSKKLRNKFSLDDNEIIELSKNCLIIEKHYSQLQNEAHNGLKAVVSSEIPPKLTQPSHKATAGFLSPSSPVLKNMGFSATANKWTPMDIEWAKDKNDQIFIIQARYETIHAQNQSNILKKYIIQEDPKILTKKLILQGQSVGQKISTGIVKIIKNINEINSIKEGDILVTTMTNPDWVPAMKIAAGIITDQGGRTCHAAIVSREFGIPAIIGTANATQILKNNEEITIDCSQGEIGNIYKGKIDFKIQEFEISKIKKIPFKLMINSGNPDQVFSQSFLPVDGVGLARIEFIIASKIKIHPLALIHFDQIKDKKTQKQIEQIVEPYENEAHNGLKAVVSSEIPPKLTQPSHKATAGFLSLSSPVLKNMGFSATANKKDYFINVLAQEAGTIAAAFYPKPVLLRFSDLKTNEYRNLIGGNYFEPHEENPMLGLRGASRYYSDFYQPAFELECAAMKKIIFEMGLTNVKLMIPFVRTIQEAEKVLKLMEQFGLKKTKDLEIIMMCEIPSNVILIDEFSNFFDGFSIGSNDLTQFTLAVDRDSEYLTKKFNENDVAVRLMMKMAIDGAKKNNKNIGICGQGPSDYPDLAKYLIECGISSISLNADKILEFYEKF